LAGYLRDAWDAGLSMRKHVAVLIVVVVVLAGLVAGFWQSTARDREVRSHLRNLEYWQRVQFRKLRWTDWLVPTTWSERRRMGSNPRQEVDNQYDALVSLGFLMKHSFVLSAPMTNRGDLASLDQKVRSAPFSDAHWRFSHSDNRIDALICDADLPLWEEVIHKWEVERSGTFSQPRPANRRQPFGSETNQTPAAAGSHH